MLQILSIISAISGRVNVKIIILDANSIFFAIAVSPLSSTILQKYSLKIPIAHILNTVLTIPLSKFVRTKIDFKLVITVSNEEKTVPKINIPVTTDDKTANTGASFFKIRDDAVPIIPIAMIF